MNNQMNAKEKEHSWKYCNILFQIILQSESSKDSLARALKQRSRQIELNIGP